MQRLNNIARVYEEKEDKINSIKYYKLVKKYGNDEAKEYAKGKLEKLQKK